MIVRIIAVLFVALFQISIGSADSAPTVGSTGSASKGVYVPSDLAPWVEWVKDRHPEWNCSRNGGNVECVWPGRLQFAVNSSGATFTLAVEVQKESSVPLPSTEELFPRQIVVRSETGEAVSAPLSVDGGNLAVQLPRGKFQIQGSFTWDALPPEIPVPSSYGIVEVKIPSELGALQTRRGPGSVWLEKKEENVTTDSLSISVMRRVSDGSPLSVDTLIRLRISGRSRALQIPLVLPAGSSAVTIESPLPAQLSPDGTLAMQLLPGEYDVHVLSLLQQPVTAIKVPQVNLEDWPNEEVWSWQPDMSFRSVELVGGQPLLADLTQLPSEWKSGAIYVMQPNGALELKETRRGEQSQAPNQIKINRQVWIDLDGKGATFSDVFNGRLNKDFRINALEETKVGRATIDGQPGLITTDPSTSASGVELRNQTLNMQVISRVDDSRSYHATGWNVTADQLGLSLNLPPSWRLLHVGGAMFASGSWVDTWTLLDIFICILLVLAAFKLFGRAAAIVLGISFLINHNEFLAPRMLYVHLLLLAAWCLVTDSKESFWRTLSRTLLAITYAAWALQSLAFAKLQFTQLLFPQLQAGTRYRTILQELISVLEDSVVAWPMMLVVLAAVLFAIRSIFSAKGAINAIVRIVLFGIGFVFLISMMGGLYGTLAYRLGGNSRSVAFRNVAPQTMEMSLPESSGVYDSSESMPAAIAKSFGRAGGRKDEVAANTAFSYQGKNLLSGPAVPTWRWHTHQVAVATPVDPSHKLRFYLLSPWLSSALSAVRSLLTMLLIVLVFKALGFSLRNISRVSSASPGATVLVLLGLFFHVGSAYAEAPRKELLDELESKIARKLCSKAECVVVEAAEFACTESRFKVTLRVTSDGISSFPVPGPLDVLTPDVVRVNGRETSALRRADSGFLEVRTEPGANVVELEGALPGEQSFTVQFNELPLFTSISAPAWYVEGLSASGFVRENLRFVSRATKSGAKQIVPSPTGSEGLKTWVRVSRSITIGEQVSLTTEIVRLGSVAAEAHVRVPLLIGEQITSGLATIEKNELLVGFPAGTSEQSFTSRVPFAAAVELLAKDATGISEEWIVSCQPIIACTFEGLQPTATTINNLQAAQWLPFPGEKVRLNIKVLTGLPGEFVTVDDVRHQVRWGTNLLEGTLRANVRATQQTTFKITSPAESNITTTLLDGKPGQSSENDGVSSLLLSPGSHAIELSYSKNWSAGLREVVPTIAISAPANNLTITVQPSANRWILWTGGLPWGPCVVFWAKMLLVIAICVALAQVGLLPASTAGAVMLGVGLTTLPIVAMVIPLLWLGTLVLLPKSVQLVTQVPRWIRVAGFVALSLLSLIIWFEIVQTGLALQPPMLIAGNGSSSYSLVWYTDHVTGALPSPWVISLPIWCWRVVALVWSTWLVVALFGWLKRCVAIMKSEFVSGIAKS